MAAKKNQKDKSAPSKPKEQGKQNPLEGDGIFVAIGKDAEGNPALNVHTVGGTSVMEAPTILELASKRVKAQLGL